MTYSPAQAGIMTGEDFFTSIGLIGGSTGMNLLPCSMPKTITTPDGYNNGYTISITDSVIGSSDSSVFCSWNLDGGDGSTTYDKTLVLGYLKNNASILSGFGVSNTVFPADTSNNSLEAGTLNTTFAGMYAHLNALTLSQYTAGPTLTNHDTHTDIQNESRAYDPVSGVALYSEVGAPGVQKSFYKMGGRSQWIQIASETETQLVSATMYWYGCATTAVSRLISPVMTWGVES